MDELWRVVAELALELHPRRMEAVADRVTSTNGAEEFAAARASFGPNVDPLLVGRLEEAWRSAGKVHPRELAAALRAASSTASLAGSRGAIELVWSGPSSGIVPVRHTEQALGEVIDHARQRIFLVSFVAYEVPSVTKALRAAADRGVRVDALLESSVAHGGSVTVDSVRVVKDSLPTVNVFVWKPDAKGTGDAPGKRSVHAKCAVADGALAFVTSANLSTAAMERNMEVGVLVRGGPLPDSLDRHLAGLVTTGIVEKV